MIPRLTFVFVVCAVAWCATVGRCAADRLIPVAGCAGDWKWLSPKPLGGGFDKFLRTATSIVGLRAGICVRTTNNGDSWELHTTLFESGGEMNCSFDLNAVVVEDSIIVARVHCPSDNIIESTDEGIHWRAVGGFPKDMAIDDFGMITRRVGWCTSHWDLGLRDAGVAALFLTSDAGQTWRLVRTDSTVRGRTYFTTAFLDSLHYWFACDWRDSNGIAAQYFIRTSDGGSSWKKDQMSHDSTSPPTVDMHFIDALHGVGESYYADTYVYTLDGGSTWRPFGGPHFTSLANWGASRFRLGTEGTLSVILYGRPDTASGLPGPVIYMATTDHGSTWSRDTSYVMDDGTIGNIADISILSDAFGIITLGNGAGFLLTSNHGTSWQLSNTFQTGRISGLFFLDSVRGFALVGDRAPKERNGLYRTNDAGMRWQKVPRVTGSPSGYSMPNRRHIYVVCEEGNVFHSFDSGSTFWEIATVPPHQFPFRNIQFVDSLFGWLFSQSNGIWKTTDGGATWVQEREEIPIHDSEHLGIFSDASMVDREYGWAIEDVLLRTTNGGAVWDTLGTGFLYTYGFQFVSRTHGYLFSYGPAQETTDGGLSWHATTVGGPALHFRDSLFGWCGGRITTDGGQSWVDRSCYNVNARLAWWADTSQGWVTDVNSDNYLFHFGEFHNAVTHVSSEQEPNPLPSLLKCYPNPFSRTTALIIDTRTLQDRATSSSWLRVYNTLGIVVADLSRRLSLHESTIAFDGSALPSGTYFCRGIIGDATIHERLIVLH